MSPTHDYILSNQSGASFRTDLNNALAAIVSNNSNSSSPATTYAYQWWADTSAGTLKIRNSANNAWIELLQLDGTITLEDGSAATPALANRGDLDTGVFFGAANQFNIATGGVERVKIDSTAVIFNETGANVDFRIEGDTGTHLFFLDAGNDRVGINTTSPQTLLHMESSADTILRVTSADGSAAFLDLGDASDPDGGRIHYDSGSNLVFNTTSTERMRIDSSGRVLIGSTSADDAAQMLKVARTSGSARLAIQAANDGSSQLDFADVADADVGRIQYNHNSDYMALFTQNSERMRIDSSGNVHIANSGFSATTSSDDLTVGNLSGEHGITIFSSTDSAGFICFGDTNTTAVGSRDGVIRYQQSDNSMRFATNGNNERMRLTSIGTMQVSNMGSFAASDPTFHDFSADSANDLILRLRNTSSTNPYGLRINFDNAAPNDSTRYFIYCVDSSGVKFQVNSNGGIQNFQSNDSNLCDQREKKNIASLENKWDKVKSWELKKFHYNEDADTDDLRYGVIAQQVEEHCPEVLTDWIKVRAEDAVLDEDGNVVKEAVAEIARKGVKEQQMMWMAIKALQEAQTRIETLETKVAALEAA